MRIPRIYQNIPLKINETVELNEWAVQHSVIALRLKAGYIMQIFNGIDEGEFEAELVVLGKKSYAAKILRFTPKKNESPLYTHLAQGISRPDRMDYALQKAVELGVNEITPLFTEYCSVKLSEEQLESRFRHWQNILISACEQSARCKVPVLNPPQFFLDFITTQKSDINIIFEPESAVTLNDLDNDAKSVSFIIGPEGGFSERELELSKINYFNFIKIGPRVVRTETATVIALSLLQAKWGDL